MRCTLLRYRILSARPIGMVASTNRVDVFRFIFAVNPLRFYLHLNSGPLPCRSVFVRGCFLCDLSDLCVLRG